MGIGLFSRWQFGRESTWGTAGTVTKRKPILSSNPDPGASVIKSNALDGKLVRANAYQGAQLPKAVIDTEFNDGDAELLLLDCVMGSASFGANGGSTTGPVGGIYTHVFKHKEFVNSLTCELIEGNIPSTKCQRLLGGKVDEFLLRGEWSQGQEGICRAQYSLMGKQYQTNQNVTGSLTSDAVRPWMFNHLTTKDIGGTGAANVILRSFQLRQKNNLVAPPNMGSLYSAEQVRGDFIDVELEFVARFLEITAVDEFLNTTDGSPQLVFTNGTHILTIDMPKGKITSHGHTISGPGIVEQQMTWEALDDAASPSSGITITVATDVVDIT